jgi:hypothetical protein
MKPTIEIQAKEPHFVSSSPIRSGRFLAFFTLMVFAVSACGCSKSSNLFRHGSRGSESRTKQNLTIALDSENPDDRRKALLSLVKEPGAKSEQAFRALDVIARTDTSSSVRQAAVAVLGNYSDSRPVDTLLQLLRFKEYPKTVRPADDPLIWFTVDSLNGLAARGLVPQDRQDILVETLTELQRSSRNHQVRVSATQTLGRFDTLAATDALIEGLTSRDFGVAFEARVALRTLTGLDAGTDPTAWRRLLDETDAAGSASLVDTGNAPLSGNDDGQNQ